MTEELHPLAQSLLQWYDQNGRELPWREEVPDPYKVWVSEIMLQQTRVEAVREFYHRWLERFPTLQALAVADEEDVLRYWNGLGYYSRARNLQAGAREVCNQYGGRFPEEREAALALPGIGAYTAGAILSIVYGKAEPAVDGNVLRVFSRLFCLEGSVQKSALRRAVEAEVVRIQPRQRPGDFNQAIMDLGALVCIPKQPRCHRCPLHLLCQAAESGRAAEFPQRQAKKAVPVEEMQAVMLCWQGRYLLRRRPKRGLLAEMWEFPTWPQAAAGEEKIANRLGELLRVRVTSEREWGKVEHVFTHRIWRMQFITMQLQGEPEPLPEGYVWWSPAVDQAVVLAGPHRKVAQRLLEEQK